MKKIFFLRVFLLPILLFMTGSVVRLETLQLDMVNPGYHETPDWFKSSFLDIGEDIEEASSNHKRVLLYFYQDGCPYCTKLLQVNLRQKKIVDTMRQYFDVIAINMWGDREVTARDGRVMTEKTFATRLKVMYTPTLLFFAENKKTILRINGYYAPHKFQAALDYVAGKYERKISFRDFYRKMSPIKLTGKLHPQNFILKPPYNLQQLLKKNKPLLILFEQKQCQNCDELHTDVFKRQETIKQITRFNVVRLDIWSDEKLLDFQGEESSMKNFAKSLNVLYTPSLIFFDRTGRDVFRTEAYLKSFHLQSVMDYIASDAYKIQPNFQRFISARADKLEAQGQHIDLMK